MLTLQEALIVCQHGWSTTIEGSESLHLEAQKVLTLEYESILKKYRDSSIDSIKTELRKKLRNMSEKLAVETNPDLSFNMAEVDSWWHKYKEACASNE